MDNQEILQKIKNNDHRVIADFYKSCRNEFIGFALKNYRLSIELSKEIYQDAFLVMYRNIISGKLTELKSSLKTYLFQIGKNQIHNELRRESRLSDIGSQSGIQDNSLHDFDSNSEKENLIRKAVRQSILKLSEKCRELLRLFYYEKKKHEEIMLILNYSTVDSVKTQKYKCFKKLETLVKSEHDKSEFY